MLMIPLGATMKDAFAALSFAIERVRQAALSLAALLFCLSLAIPVAACPLEDGTAAYDRGDYAEALQFLRPIAGQGNATAQSGLGKLYFGGQAVPRDYQIALTLFRGTSEHEFAPAQV